MRYTMLTTLLLAGCALGATAWATNEEDKGCQGPAEQIQGTWVMASGEKAGQKAPAKDAASVVVVITRDTLTFARGGHRETMKVSLDATATPNQVTLTGGDGKPRPGIFEVAGDTLKLCLSGDDARPKDFGGTEGTRTALMVFARKKQ